MVAGAACLKKPHHIVLLRFSEVVKGHANYLTQQKTLPFKAFRSTGIARNVHRTKQLLPLLLFVFYPQ